jgi:hypothetical protein
MSSHNNFLLISHLSLSSLILLDSITITMDDEDYWLGDPHIAVLSILM